MPEDPISLVEAAEWTPRPAEPHQATGWEYVQSILTTEELKTFAGFFRTPEPPEHGSHAKEAGDIGIELIKLYEGCRLTAYPDPRTGGEPWTIGYGTTVYPDGGKVRQGDTCTQEQADEWLEIRVERDYDIQMDRVANFANLNAPQQGAILSFAYNLGAYWFGSSGFDTISANFRDMAWSAVPGTLMMYRNPGSSVEIGLGRRRYAEGLVWRGTHSPENAQRAAWLRIDTPDDCEAVEQQLKAAGEINAPTQPSAPSGPIQIPGAVGPQKTPQECGFKPDDTHLVMNDLNETITAYDFHGTQLWSVPALARGQYADDEWQIKNSDTPPGLYKLGKLYNDVAEYGAVPPPPYNSTLQSYGWQTYDMVELENQEAENFRAGICLHGGGSACGWPGAWKPKQRLSPTLGCVRMHNKHLLELVYPRYEMGTVFMSVYQEEP